MHPDAAPFLDAVADPDMRAKLAVFLELFDKQDRENTHLRLVLGREHPDHCPYGHFKPERGCQLGYPGCACMDDLMALTAWSPEDEDKAAVRIGRLLTETRRVLEAAQQTLVGAALHMESRRCNPSIIAACRKMAGQKVRSDA